MCDRTHVLLLLLLFGSFSTINALHDHVQMHSLYPPILAEYWETGLHYWSFGSHSVVTDDYVRLTTLHPSAHGYLWNRHPNHLESFEVNITLKMKNRADKWFQDRTSAGIVLWYTAAAIRHVAPTFYGAMDTFVGLGVVLDHSNHISIVHNNGDSVYSLSAVTIASCSVPRVAENFLTIFLRYENSTERGSVYYMLGDTELPEPVGQDTPMVFCATVNVKLPLRSYFGVTATNTENSACVHEVRSIFVKPLRSTSNNGGDGNKDAADEEEDVVGLHLFDLTKDQQERREWDGKGDVNPKKNAPNDDAAAEQAGGGTADREIEMKRRVRREGNLAKKLSAEAPNEDLE